MNRRIVKKTIRISGLLMFFLLNVIVTRGQSIEWLSWEEAFEKSEVQKRKFIVDIYTEWCTWCKKMDQTTFSDPTVIEYINANFYAIKFDAEEKDPIQFQGQIYKFENGIWRGGYHQLAAKITNNRIKLPTVVFLDERSEILQSIGGYRNAYEMEMMSDFFAGDHHKSTPWKTFVGIFQLKKNKGQIQNDSSNTRMVSNNKN